MTTKIKRFYNLVADIVAFARLASLPGTTLPLFAGGFLASPHLSAAMILQLGAVGFAAHVYGFVLNDVVDLNIDRKNPRRQGSPLVQGLVSPRVALFVAVAMIPLAHMILSSVTTSSAVDHLLLSISYILVGVYDIFGKRSAFPLLVSDLSFGVAMGILPLLGSHLATGEIRLRVVIMGIFFTLQLILLNSIHGGMKDIDTDLASGAVTTPIWWGVRAESSGFTRYPPSLRVYGMILQSVSIILLLFVALSGLQEAGSARGVATLLIILSLSVWVLIDTWKVLWTRNLELLRDPRYRHIMLTAVMVSVVLLLFATNWIIITVIVVSFSWDRLFRNLSVRFG